jgi:hypothetical protein
MLTAQHCEVLATLRKAGFAVPDIPAVWGKPNTQGQTAQPFTTLGSSYEPFFLCRKGQPEMSKPGRSNLFLFDAISLALKDHPTQKPLALMEELLTLSPNRGRGCSCSGRRSPLLPPAA